MNTTISASSARKMIWNTKLRLDIASSPTTAISTSPPYVWITLKMSSSTSGKKLKFALMISSAYTITSTTARISPMMSKNFSAFLNIESSLLDRQPFAAALSLL